MLPTLRRVRHPRGSRMFITTLECRIRIAEDLPGLVMDCAHPDAQDVQQLWSDHLLKQL